MLPAPRTPKHARATRVRHRHPAVAAAALITALAGGIVARPAFAQVTAAAVADMPAPGDVAAPAAPAVADASASAPASVQSTPQESEPIGFEADRIEYADNDETIAAVGSVVLRREGQSVRADKVTWNRKTGQIVATGNIRLVDADGNQLFTDRVELTDELETGAMQDMLLALREGGRLAAESGRRQENGDIVLTRAAYTACAVEDEAGCPKTPTWRVTANQVTYYPDRKSIRFKGARLELFGARLLPLPWLLLTTDGRPINGPLIPDFRFTPSNGMEFSEAWYQRLGDNRDLTARAYVYTEAPPMLQAQYRALTERGAYQITGYATRSQRIALSNGDLAGDRVFRGYVFANGRFQLSPTWSVTGSIRRTTDRTFLRRYDISRDDRLRSMVDIERIDANSYLTIAGWATQTMRVGDNQGQVPVALPVIDYRRRIDDPLLGGRFELQANSLAIVRNQGQDTQRAFASARWDMRRVTGWGQEVTLTGLLRGDVYHSDENDLTATAIYRGNPGWQTRGLATAAVDVKWPLVGNLFGGTHVLTPRVQVVASPSIRNLEVPNEDARAIELEDSNLFALNRFPGYDRIEDGVRFTYGLDWQLDVPRWRIKTTIGQSYRLTREPTLLPDGTGLSNRTSDIVGRTEVRYRDFVKLTHRFRLDKDNLAVRRNEFDLAVGSRQTYAEVGYLRLNRDIAAGLEDLRDREELRVAARAALVRYWSVFGSGVFNLTDRNEDASNTSDGFQPLRTRLGVSYRDDCIELALTWQRNFMTTGDARSGNSFQIYFALRNLGFR